MNKKLMNAANSNLRTHSYETPAVSVIEVQIEGGFCLSGDIEKWSEEDNSDLWGNN